MAPPQDDELPTTIAELVALEREYAAWLAKQRTPLGLVEAVLEDRR